MKNIAAKKRPGRSHSIISDILIVFLAIFLLVMPGSYRTIAEFKTTFFLAAFGIFAVAAVLLAAELRIVGGSRRGAGTLAEGLHISPAELCAAAYLLFSAVSALLSPYPGVLMGNGRGDGLVSIALYAAMFVMLRRTLVPKGRQLAVLGVSVCAVCLFGLPQLFGKNPLGLYPEGMDYFDAGVLYAGQFWSTIGNAGYCTSILSLAAGAFSAAFIRLSGRRSMLMLIPVVLAVFSLVALRTEAGYVALAVGLVVGLPFVVNGAAALARWMLVCGSATLAASAAASIAFSRSGPELAVSGTAVLLAALGVVLLVGGCVLSRAPGACGMAQRRLRAVLALAVLALLLLGLLALYFFDIPGGGFLSEAHRLLHGDLDDSYGSGRLFIWKQTMGAVLERPLLGGGPDTLGLRGLEGFSRYNEAIGQTVSSSIDAAHNEYLNIWVNQGLFALIAYLGLLVCSAVRWWQAPDDTAAAVGGLGALFYLIQAFFGISCPICTPYLWAALAAVNKEQNTGKEVGK